MAARSDSQDSARHLTGSKQRFTAHRDSDINGCGLPRRGCGLARARFASGTAQRCVRTIYRHARGGSLPPQDALRSCAGTSEDVARVARQPVRQPPRSVAVSRQPGQPIDFFCALAGSASLLEAARDRPARQRSEKAKGLFRCEPNTSVPFLRRQSKGGGRGEAKERRGALGLQCCLSHEVRDDSGNAHHSRRHAAITGDAGRPQQSEGGSWPSASTPRAPAIAQRRGPQVH